ncbi:MAG: hypothetical protein E7515_02175 [Ruminococcaceae bacterium]|jgi:hypothetical protein|nr:hypothetical protein [Oscillospiraceae bacterium]
MLSPRKWKFLENFKLGPEGSYVYTGETYSLKADYKKAYLIFVVFGVSLALCVIGSGLINAAGMNNTFYVIIPYIAEVISLFVILWSNIKLVYAGEKVRAYVYEPTRHRIPEGTLALAVFSAASLLGSIVFTALHGFEGKMLLCIVFWLLKVLTVLLSLAFNRFFKKKEWVKL